MKRRVYRDIAFKLTAAGRIFVRKPYLGTVRAAIEDLECLGVRFAFVAVVRANRRFTNRFVGSPRESLKSFNIVEVNSLGWRIYFPSVAQLSIGNKCGTIYHNKCQHRP